MNEAVAAAQSGDWDKALVLLQRDAAAGDALARGQLEILAGRDLNLLSEPPKPERIPGRGALHVIKDFAPPGFCDWFIERARHHLEPSLMNSSAGLGVADPRRTALVYPIESARCDVLTVVMQARNAAITGYPIAYHEPPSVISYEPGQKFDYHHDFVDPEVAAFAPDIGTFGQRVATIVTYLNDDFEGAATDFPLLGIRFRGKRGEAVAFANVLANGAPDRSTLHAGLPPNSGRKWVLSQWTRNKVLPGV